MVSSEELLTNLDLCSKNIESWLPVSYWRPLNPLLVGHGQLVCKAVKPLCGECDAGREGMCPSAKGEGTKKYQKVAVRDGAVKEAVKEEALPLLSVELDR